MNIEQFIAGIKKLGIDTMIGVPDSTLKVFCDYLNSEGGKEFVHYVPANEGAAAGIAVGTYLATGRPACIYMQNSGLGNFVNPYTSIMNKEVYRIPGLLITGWRGEPGVHDEPQHKFMGAVTRATLELLEIEYEIIDKFTDTAMINVVFEKAQRALSEGKIYCILVKKGTFEEKSYGTFQNKHTLIREHVIAEILKVVADDDILVSTTGKISREVYEQSDLIKGQHVQEFLTVGGMGHASMIAFGLAKKNTGKRTVCIEGDGALLMHMGSMAFIGKQQPDNFIHICLNNDAHESVGGMPTGASGTDYYKVAEACGYTQVMCIEDKKGLDAFISGYRELKGTVFVEIKVAMDSRKNLGRPKETAEENKIGFMKYHEVRK